MIESLDIPKTLEALVKQITTMDLQDKVQNALNAVVEQELECGCQAVLYIDGKLEVNVSAGWTDWSRTKKVDENTIFPIYSAG